MSTIRDRVLNWTNRIRADLGLNPLDSLRPGICKDAARCVIAESIVFGSDYGIEVSPDTDNDGIVTIDSQKPDDPGILALDKRNGFPDNHYSLGVHMVTLALPKYVNDFALRFDRKRYPDLIADRIPAR